MFNPENIESKKDDDVRSEEKNDIQNEEGVDITSDENGDIRREEGIDVPYEENGNVISEEQIDNRDAVDDNNDEPYTLDTSTKQQRIQILSAILDRLNNLSHAYNNSVPCGQAASATVHLFAPDPARVSFSEETAELYKKIAEEAAQLPTPEFIQSPANSPRSYTEEVAIPPTLEENNETNELSGHAYFYTHTALSNLALPTRKARRSFIPRAIPQVAAVYSDTCSMPRSATLYSFDENAVSNQNDNQDAVKTSRDRQLLEMLFSTEGVKELILSQLSFLPRKYLRLMNRNINHYLWQVRRDIHDQYNIVYAKRIIILHDGYEVQICIFVKKSGKIIFHLTDYKNSVTREIVLPKNEVVKEIAHSDNKSYCSQIITESGNCYWPLYFIENHRIADERFIALSPQRMQIDKEKIRQVLSIRGGIQFLTETGNIHWVNGFDENGNMKTVIIPRPDNNPVRRVSRAWGSMLTLTNSGQILIYNTQNIDESIRTKTLAIAPPTFFSLPGIKFKKFVDIAIDASSIISFAISEQDDLYLLDTEYNLSMLVSLPNNEKIEQGLMGNGHVYTVTRTGSLYYIDVKFTVSDNLEDRTKARRIPQFTITPISLPKNEKAKQVDSCYGSVLVVTQSGRLLTFGLNSLGELALGHKNPVPLPVYLILPELYKDNNLKQFYQLLSSQHLKWFNCWQMQNGNDFDKVISLLKIYLEQNTKCQAAVFTLSEHSLPQPAYSLIIQKVINQCLAYSQKDGSVVSENDCFNHFTGLLKETFSRESLDFNSELYALLDVIQLETNRVLLSVNATHNNAITTRLQTEKSDFDASLRLPRS